MLLRRITSVSELHRELWGIAIAYNLVRLEMERVAAVANVEPTRISFVAALSLICLEWQRASSPRAAIGNIPRDLKTLRLNLKRLVIPPRRSNRSFPRSVKIKMSPYTRKRPMAQAAK